MFEENVTFSYLGGGQVTPADAVNGNAAGFALKVRQQLVDFLFFGFG